MMRIKLATVCCRFCLQKKTKLCIIRMLIRMKHRSHPTSTCLTATAPGAPTVPRGVHSCNNIGKLFIITMFIFFNSYDLYISKTYQYKTFLGVIIDYETYDNSQCCNFQMLSVCWYRRRCFHHIRLRCSLLTCTVAENIFREETIVKSF